MTETAKRKLLYILTVRYGTNGITAFVMNAWRHLDRERFNADFVLLNDPPEAVRQEMELAGSRVYVLPNRNRKPLAYRKALAKLIRDNGYDIVHIHGNSCTMAVELTAAKLGGAKVRIPHSHNTTCNQKVLHRLLRRSFDKNYTHAFACGDAAGKWLYGDKPFTVVQNAIDTAAFRFDPALRADMREQLRLGNGPVVCHVGSFNTQKNHAFLLEVFSALHAMRPEARLLLVGEGPKEQEIRDRAEQLGLTDAVVFTGGVTHTAPYLCAADVFLLPSLFEGLPFTLIEAQCAGLPCLVSDTVTRDAFLTPLAEALPLSAPAQRWAKGILAMLDKGGDRAAAARNGLNEVAKAGFDSVAAANRLMDAYDRCLSLRSLFLVTHKMTGGGCERVIAQLLNRWTAEGMDCTLITECKVPSFYPLDGRIRFISLLNSPAMGATDIPGAYRKLRKLVKRERPDVVLAMPEKVNVWTVLFLLGLRTPVVVSERNDPRRHPESRLKRLLRRILYPFAQGFIFQTEDAANYFSPAIRKRGVVLPNPLETSRLPAPRFQGRSKTVIGAGRLNRQKNFPLLLAAFRKFYQTHPDWTLVLYGEGEERGSLLALAEGLPEGAVALPGQTDKLPEKLGNCGMFVLSSDFEGMPNVLIEAMAVGTPSIATDCPVGGCRALVESGVNGILIPVGEKEALVDAMTRLAEDPGFAQSLGQAAAKVRARLDAGVISEEWRRYLGTVAGK